MRKAPATEVLAMDSLTAVDTFNRDNRERKAKLWNLATMKRFVPVGAEPIATRYDPALGVLHIACSDGNVYDVAWTDALAAERDVARERPEPMILDPNTLEPAKLPNHKPGPWEVEYKDLPRLPDEVLQRQIEAMHQAIQDAQDARQQQAQVNKAKAKAAKQQQQEQQQQSPQEGPPDEWEVARGRCAEYEMLHGKQLCSCNRDGLQRCHNDGGRDYCTQAAEVAMIPTNNQSCQRRDHKLCCEECAHALMRYNVAKLDCDPDAGPERA